MTTETSPFTNAEKAARYDSGRYQGATGLNWYLADPALRRTLRFYMTDRDFAWAQPLLEEAGAIMGTVVTQAAEEVDRDPPRLVRYDRWGHDVSDVVMPEAAARSKRAVLELRARLRDAVAAARDEGIHAEVAGFAEGYMLDQADIGMTCALGTGTAMITRLVSAYAPPDIRELVLSKFATGEWEGETAQLFTERTGGSDLGAMETTATPDGDAWKLNGFKWFASNANGQVYVVLAKPVGAPDNVKGVCSFLVMRQRRDGSPNGVHIRRLKDKLGTRTVASCEVEFVDAEAFLMSGEPSDADGAVGGDGQGLARMMQMTNDARLGVATMGLGCARRALVESLCYAKVRNAFGRRLIDHPLMKRKLAEMIVDVEATLAMLMDAHGYQNRLRERGAERLRLTPAVIKLKAARLGVTMASDAIEIHGGNGYIETWPVARILRDAQVNTIWEGPDNIICLDVRRAMEREQADVPFIERLHEAVDNAGELPVAGVVRQRLADLEAAIDAWKALNARNRELAEARLFPLAQFMGDVYGGAALAEQAAWELREYGDSRKELVADLFAARYLGDGSPLRGIDAPSHPAIERFDELLAGALVEARV